jgi:hypothetical protein
MAHVDSIGIEQKDGGEHLGTLRLNHSQERIENFRKRLPARDQLQYAILSFQQFRAFTSRRHVLRDPRDRQIKASLISYFGFQLHADETPWISSRKSWTI